MHLIEHEQLAHLVELACQEQNYYLLMDFLRYYNAENHQDTEKIRLWYARLRTFESSIGSRNLAAEELMSIDCNCKLCDG